MRALAYGNGQVYRWPAGAALRHCAGPGIDQGVVAAAADLITRTAGLPRTEAGACAVTWEMDPAPGHPNTTLSVGDGGVIVSARVVLRAGDQAFSAGHEAGHVMGLSHSPRRQDLMFATSRGGFDFTADELAILDAMYPR